MKNQSTLPKRLSDEAPAGGELTKMEDIAGQDLILCCAEPTETTYGRGYRLGLSSMDRKIAYEVLTSAVVVVKQLDKALEKDPFAEMIVKFERQGRCWIIV